MSSPVDPSVTPPPVAAPVTTDTTPPTTEQPAAPQPTTAQAVEAAKAVTVNDPAPVEQYSLRSKYTYIVSPVGVPQFELFTISIIEYSPELVAAKVNKVLIANVADPKVYSLRLKSIDVLE